MTIATSQRRAFGDRLQPGEAWRKNLAGEARSGASGAVGPWGSANSEVITRRALALAIEGAGWEVGS